MISYLENENVIALVVAGPVLALVRIGITSHSTASGVYLPLLKLHQPRRKEAGSARPEMQTLPELERGQPIIDLRVCFAPFLPLQNLGALEPEPPSRTWGRDDQKLRSGNQEI